MAWLGRILSLFRENRVARDLDDELQHHIEMRIRENLASGMGPEEARRAAMDRFGNVTQWKEQARDRDVNRWLDAAWQNLRYAARVLRKNPGFAVVAALSMAIGIGANTAIFSLLNALLLKSLPVRNPQELVAVNYTVLRGKNAGRTYTGVAYPAYRELRDRGSAVADLMGLGQAEANLSSGGDLERIKVEMVSGNFFPVLGVQAAVGRLIGPEDDRVPSGHPVTVLSYSYWRDRLGGGPIDNRRLVLNGVTYQVIGVAPRGFSGTRLATAPDVYVPMMMQPEIQGEMSALDKPGWKWMNIDGRLRPGVSIGAATAALTSAMQEIGKDNRFGMSPDYGVALEPAGRGVFMRDKIGKPICVLMAAVSLVLLIACANVANLTLARTAARRREISVRMAIGASRSHLAAQLLTESLLVSLVGGAIGVALAYATDSGLLAILRGGPNALPLDARPDGGVLLFTLGVSLVTGVLFGLYPAIEGSRSEVSLRLKDSGGSGGRRQALRRTLVVAQIALSLVLLAGAALFARTLANLRNLDAGYDRHGVLLANLDPRLARYTGERMFQFYDDLLERVRRIPGVDAAGVASTNVLSGGGVTQDVAVEGQTQRPEAILMVVSQGYIEAMRMRLLAGRSFVREDNLPKAPRTAVINETLAHMCFGDSNPVGRHIGIREKADTEIIGVTRSAKYRDLRDPERPLFYIPVRQYAQQSMGLHVRTSLDPMYLAGPIRRELREMHAAMPLGNVHTLEEQSERSLGQDRLLALLSAAFAAAAITLAVVGLYGVLAFLVARRRPEIGVRIALGASRGDVVWLVLRESAGMAAAGAAIGLWGAFAARRLVEGLLFGVSAFDGLTLAAAAGALFATALAAAWIPARRASRIDPTTALRWE